MSWLLIHAKPSCESKASMFLTREGATVYFPQLQRRIKHARQQICRVVPLFPRYMFVFEDGAVQPSAMRYLPGVSNLVRCGIEHEYARVDDAVIEALRDGQHEDGLFREPPPPSVVPLRYGDAVRVLPLDGIAATFLRMKGEERVVLLLSLFGRTHEQVLGLHQIERLAA